MDSVERRCGELHRAFDLAVLEQTTGQLESLRRSDGLKTAVPACWCGRFFIGLRVALVEGFQKFLAEFAIAFRHQPQHFAAEIRSAANNPRFTPSLESLDLFGALARCF